VTVALTVRQPYASLIVSGRKTVELRSWPTSYRGPLLIHAGRHWTGRSRELARRLAPGEPLPRGAIIGRVQLVACRRMQPGDVEPAVVCDYQPELWSWLLEGAQASEPVPMRGRQGLWNVPDEEAESGS
jgi:activating signal cointegrator 1